MGFTKSSTNITDDTTMIKIGENPLNAVITLTNVWRCGMYLYKGEEGNCKVQVNLSVANDPRFASIVLEGKSFIQITIHPDGAEYTKLCALFETIDGQPGQMWKFEYGDGDKSFTFDTNLTQEIARDLNAYRLAF